MIEQDNNYTIYMHKNKINGKVYIGQTKCKNPNDRWRNGTHYKGTYFGRAIEKYGWDNFEHIILETGILSREESNDKEQYYISKYNSNNPSFGYNLTSGGDNYEINDTVRHQRSVQMKERWQNDVFKEDMSKKMQDYWVRHPEIKQERGQTVRCVETGDIFQTYKEAGSWCGLQLPKNAFLMYFRGERMSCGKHPVTKKPLHWEKLDKNNNIIKTEKANYTNKRKNSKAVQCIETGVVFESLEDAIIWCGLANTSSISNMINGNHKSAGKHPVTKEPLHWKYIKNKGE